MSWRIGMQGLLSLQYMNRSQVVLLIVLSGMGIRAAWNQIRIAHNQEACRWFLAGIPAGTARLAGMGCTDWLDWWVYSAYRVLVA